MSNPISNTPPERSSLPKEDQATSFHPIDSKISELAKSAMGKMDLSSERAGLSEKKLVSGQNISDYENFVEKHSFVHNWPLKAQEILKKSFEDIQKLPQKDLSDFAKFIEIVVISCEEEFASDSKNISAFSQIISQFLQTKRSFSEYQKLTEELAASVVELDIDSSEADQISIFLITIEQNLSKTDVSLEEFVKMAKYLMRYVEKPDKDDVVGIIRILMQISTDLSRTGISLDSLVKSTKYLTEKKLCLSYIEQVLKELVVISRILQGTQTSLEEILQIQASLPKVDVNTQLSQTLILANIRRSLYLTDFSMRDILDFSNYFLSYRPFLGEKIENAFHVSEWFFQISVPLKDILKIADPLLRNPQCNINRLEFSLLVARIIKLWNVLDPNVEQFQYIVMYVQSFPYEKHSELIQCFIEAASESNGFHECIKICQSLEVGVDSQQSDVPDFLPVINALTELSKITQEQGDPWFSLRVLLDVIDSPQISERNQVIANFLRDFSFRESGINLTKLESSANLPLKMQRITSLIECFNEVRKLLEEADIDLLYFIEVMTPHLSRMPRNGIPFLLFVANHAKNLMELGFDLPTVIEESSRVFEMNDIDLHQFNRKLSQVRTSLSGMSMDCKSLFRITTNLLAYENLPSLEELGLHRCKSGLEVLGVLTMFNESPLNQYPVKTKIELFPILSKAIQLLNEDERRVFVTFLDKILSVNELPKIESEDYLKLLETVKNFIGSYSEFSLREVANVFFLQLFNKYDPKDEENLKILSRLIRISIFEDRFDLDRYDESVSKANAYLEKR